MQLSTPPQRTALIQCAETRPVYSPHAGLVIIACSLWDVNLRDLYDRLRAGGMLAPSIRFILEGSVLASSPGDAALRTGSWPSDVFLTLENSGFIVGRGGDGGDGARGGGDPIDGEDGGDGGPAVFAERQLEIENNSVIGGGGGGGGGGGATSDGSGNNRPGGGGGGGAGAIPGTGGRGDAGADDPDDDRSGDDGTLEEGGSGGETLDLSNYGGDGGAGGNLGQAGGNGEDVQVIPPGSGGAPGAAILGNSNVTLAAQGSIFGPVED